MCEEDFRNQQIARAAIECEESGALAWALACIGSDYDAAYDSIQRLRDAIGGEE